MKEKRFNCEYQSINSISDYIAVIEQNNLFNCISRGENNDFEYPLRAGIFRREFGDYNLLLERFHLDVETSIDASQEKHFLAFAQHHGIPTNLLDFSLSPLVSLYFSVDGCIDEGYVYFIKKNRLISITKQVIDHTFSWGMLSEFVDLDPVLMKELISLLSDAFINNQEFLVEYYEKHVDKLIAVRKENGFSRELDVFKTIKSRGRAVLRSKDRNTMWIKGHDDIPCHVDDEFYSDLRKMIEEIHEDTELYPKDFWDNLNVLLKSCTDDAENNKKIYLLMMLFKLEQIEQLRSFIENKLSSKVETDGYNIELELPFYFTYRPPIIDNRVRNQFSIFVFQPFAKNIINVQNKPALMRQTIYPDYVIKVQDPTRIKNELEALGYTLKHIYCDYDSIAKYIKNSNDTL